MARPRVTLVKLLLLCLNVASTCLTLFTGLRENPVLVTVTGRYDRIRERLRDGSINTDIADADYFRVHKLASPETIAGYTFITAPRRDPSTTGLYRSVCTNINTNSAPVMANSYDDFWGTGARRVQIYFYSISAPYCDIVNVKPAWRDKCVADHGGNATLCHQYVLSNFDTLRKNRKIRMSVNNDFGGKGVPFLRCVGRPLVPMDFQADLLNHQTYWSGGSYHLTIQTSDCRAVPLVRSDDHEHTLFLSTNIDEGADSLQAMPPGGWFSTLISGLYGIVTLTMIGRGVLLAVLHTRKTRYLPNGVRFTKERRVLRYLAPFMPTAIAVAEHQRSVLTFTGSLLVASDLWINHWLYMYMSILDTLANIRLAYVTLQVGSWMLSNKITFESYLFVCAAITRMTWIVCLLQTILRFLLKLGVRCVRATRLIRAHTRQALEWHIDGASLFLTFKLYSIMLCILLYVLMQLKGTPSFMVRAKVFKVGVYGGIPRISQFWTSEIVCDFSTLMGTVLIAGQVLGFGLLLTRYKYVANNSVMRLLQQRYVVAGWDGLMAANMLGLDPADPELVVDGRGRTKFCLGSLLQLLYLSGPSGFVHLAGDYIFHDGGLAKEPVKFRYPIATAIEMGLVDRPAHRGSAYSMGAAITANRTTIAATMVSQRVGTMTNKELEPTTATATATTRAEKKSFFDRKLRIVSEGYLGKLLFVDEEQPGQLTTDMETGLREFEVVDALSTVAILDIKWLLGNEKKIRVE